MTNYLGIDLGGTKINFVIADQDGNFLHQQRYSSPYLLTSRRLADGVPEVYIDTILTDTPKELRVSKYLAELEKEFLADAGNPPIEAKGYSLCGKTWIADGRILMIGGNTPARLGVTAGDGRIGIAVADAGEHVVAANDGNAAAHAQGIHYLAVDGIRPEETGYMILGTGFGFGVPGYNALTEIGHTPVSLIPECLWQMCGCTEGHRTACAENFVSGRGIGSTAERILLLDTGDIKRLSVQVEPVIGENDLTDWVQKTKLIPGKIDAATVMGLAMDRKDDLAAFVAELAAYLSAYAAVGAAYMFGLQRIGVGETIALANPWHRERIAQIAGDYTTGSTFLRPDFRIEATPIADPAKFGALSLVVPEARYDIWAEKMK